MNAVAEARLRRIFNLCHTLEELSKYADESKHARRLIELLLKDRPYRLTTHDQVRNCIVAVLKGVAEGRKEKSTPPPADNLVHFMPGLDTPDGHPTDPGAA